MKGDDLAKFREILKNTQRYEITWGKVFIPAIIDPRCPDHAIVTVKKADTDEEIEGQLLNIGGTLPDVDDVVLLAIPQGDRTPANAAIIAFPDWSSVGAASDSMMTKYLYYFFLVLHVWVGFAPNPATEPMAVALQSALSVFFNLMGSIPPTVPGTPPTGVMPFPDTLRNCMLIQLASP